MRYIDCENGPNMKSTFKAFGVSQVFSGPDVFHVLRLFEHRAQLLFGFRLCHASVANQDLCEAHVHVLCHCCPITTNEHKSTNLCVQQHDTSHLRAPTRCFGRDLDRGLQNGPASSAVRKPFDLSCVRRQYADV